MAFTLSVPSIACESCANTITNALHQAEPNAKVSVDVPQKTVTIDTHLSQEDVKNIIEEVGHTVSE